MTDKYYIIKVYEISGSDKLQNLVSASVLSADMLNLESEIRRLENSGIDMLHFDVMDGVFVDNITYGLPILERVRNTTKMFLDVHLMITDPRRYIEKFAAAGADLISFHLESKSDTADTIKAIKSCGIKAAVAIKPATPADEVLRYIPDLDMVLVMTVEPGFGGQSFIAETTDKVRAVRNKITELGLDTLVQVDGGINDKTAPIVKKAGANVLVSGSYLFNSKDMAVSAAGLKEEIVC